MLGDCSGSTPYAQLSVRRLAQLELMHNGLHQLQQEQKAIRCWCYIYIYNQVLVLYIYIIRCWCSLGIVLTGDEQAPLLDISLVRHHPSLAQLGPPPPDRQVEAAASDGVGAQAAADARWMEHRSGMHASLCRA